MKIVCSLTAFLAVTLGSLLAASPRSSSKVLGSVSPRFAEAPADSRIVFERNHGQAPPEVDYIARSGSNAVLLRSTEAVLLLDREPVRMRIRGAKSTSPEPLGRLQSVSNYFLGNDPAKWRTAIPHYSKIKYKNIYPGVDLLYYATGASLEYDFILAPGIEYSVIELAFEGADRITTEANGDIRIYAGGRSIRQRKPVVYQWVDGRKTEVAGAYRVTDGNQVHFALGSYDRSRELIIDPVVEYAAYVGRAGQDTGIAAAVDSTGNAYIAGETNSGDLATSAAAQTSRGGDTDVFVAKYSPRGSLLYLTYLGGRLSDTGRGIAVDASGNAYVAGTTSSRNDFPTRGGVQVGFGGGELDVFVAKLDPSGSQLSYSTFVGGGSNDFATNIAVDSQGGAWVTGWTRSTDFPVRTPLQSATAGGGEDAFITRIDPNGGLITYSTFFGGDGRDIGMGIASDAQGTVYITGSTTSSTLPQASRFQAANAGLQDAFVAKLRPTDNTLVYATFLGGPRNDMGSRIAADDAGNAYVMGFSESPNFPTTRGSLQTTPAGGTDIVAFKLNPAGSSLLYSTYIGGNGEDFGMGGLAVDVGGTAYIAGWTNSRNFPSQSAVQPQYGGGTNDAVVVRVSPNGDALLYSTVYGGRGDDKAYGIGLDRSGAVWIAGHTDSSDLPSAYGEFTGSTQQTRDAFVARLSADAAANLIGGNPSALTIQGRTGENAQGTLSITGTGGALNFQLTSNVPWLTVSPQGGTTPAQITVTVNTAQLAAGSHSGEIVVSAPTAINGTLRIPVTVNLGSTPVIASISPAAITRGAGDTEITLTGGGFTPQSFVEVNGSRVPTTFVGATSLRATLPALVTAQPGAVRVVVVNADARSAVATVTVALGGAAISSVASAATGQAGGVAPGQIVTISGSGFGPGTPVNATVAGGRLATSLAETRILFDGNPAPILYVQAGRAAAVVPFSVVGRTTSEVAVEWRGERSAPSVVPIVAAAPGLFTTDGSGSGQAAALNENGSSNSAQNPAARRSILVFYATGDGPLSGTDGAIVTGVTPTSANISVMIGGVPAEVLYAGGVPGQVTGLIQINARVAESVAPGASVPVVITSGAARSAAGVTVAIQ